MTRIFNLNLSTVWMRNLGWQQPVFFFSSTLQFATDRFTDRFSRPISELIGSSMNSGGGRSNKKF